jgi:hypothetical protein
VFVSEPRIRDAARRGDGLRNSSLMLVYLGTVTSNFSNANVNVGQHLRQIGWIRLRPLIRLQSLSRISAQRRLDRNWYHSLTTNDHISKWPEKLERSSNASRRFVSVQY